LTRKLSVSLYVFRATSAHVCGFAKDGVLVRFESKIIR
jgi:hypothetical protein